MEHSNEFKINQKQVTFFLACNKKWTHYQPCKGKVTKEVEPRAGIHEQKLKFWHSIIPQFQLRSYLQVSC
jgi:hypothetical protein